MNQTKENGIIKGPIIPMTIKLAIPVTIGSLGMLLFVFSDTFFVSHIDLSSTSLLSGLGLVLPISIIITSFATGMMTGTSVIVGRAIGENNKNILNSITSSTLCIGCCVSLPIIIIGYLFGTAFIKTLAGEELSSDVLNYGLEYFHYLLPGIVLLIILQLFVGILQGEGKTQIHGRASILFVLLNLVFDPVFIFTFKMGIAGAGLATTVSIIITLVYVLRYYIKESSIPILIQWKWINTRTINEIFRIGLPHSLMISAVSVNLIFFNKFIGSISESYMNAWVMVSRMNQLLFIPIAAISTATIPMVSQNYGCNQLDRIRQIFSKNLVLCLVFFIIVALLYILISSVLFSLFSSNQTVVETAIWLVQIMAILWLLMVVTYIVEPVFQGIGQPWPPLIMEYSRISISILLGYVFVIHLKMGMNGVIYALSTGFVLAAPVSFIWLKLHLRKLTFRKI